MQRDVCRSSRDASSSTTFRAVGCRNESSSGTTLCDGARYRSAHGVGRRPRGCLRRHASKAARRSDSREATARTGHTLNSAAGGNTCRKGGGEHRSTQTEACAAGWSREAKAGRGSPKHPIQCGRGGGGDARRGHRAANSARLARVEECASDAHEASDGRDQDRKRRQMKAQTAPKSLGILASRTKDISFAVPSQALRLKRRLVGPLVSNRSILPQPSKRGHASPRTRYSEHDLGANAPMLIGRVAQTGSLGESLSEKAGVAGRLKVQAATCRADRCLGYGSWCRRRAQCLSDFQSTGRADSVGTGED